MITFFQLWPGSVWLSKIWPLSPVRLREMLFHQSRGWSSAVVAGMVPHLGQKSSEQV